MHRISSTAEPLLHAARELAPHILAARDAIESERGLPSSLAERMRAAGMFHLFLPRAYDGPELHPLDFLAVVEILSAADASAGWCAINGSLFSLLAGGLSEAGAREIFGERGIGSGSLNPIGKAFAVADGYRASGRWTYGSGIQNCHWVIGNCVIYDENGPRRSPGGAPEMRLMVFPRSEVEIIDTWRVGGLRGTGSHDFRVEGVLVPERRSVQAFTTLSVQPGALYRVPIMSLFAFALAAVALGNARAALEAFKEIAQGKIPTGSTALLRDQAERPGRPRARRGASARRPRRALRGHRGAMA